MFGGVEIDLRKAATTRDEILVEANAIFGGIEIRVPETLERYRARRGNFRRL